MFKNLYLLSLLSFIFILTGCGGDDDKNGGHGMGSGDRAAKVRTWTASASDYSVKVSAVGTLDPEDEVVLSAEVSATVRSINKDEGAEVRKGTTLAVLDRETFELIYDSARAEYENAEKTFSRMEALVSEEMVSEGTFDDSKFLRDTAKAKMNIARKDFENSVVKSPLKGFVSERFVSRGSFARVGEKLFKVVDIRTLKVAVPVPDSNIGDLKVGIEARVRVSGFPDRDFIGRVYYVSPTVDKTTRTIEVKARIDNKDLSLKPGLFADVDIIIGIKEGVFVVPENAVVVTVDGVFVFAVVDNKAVKKEVVVVERRDGKVIVGRGIEAGDIVIIDGAYSLKDGAKVDVLGAYIK